jgi:hemerythrin
MPIKWDSRLSVGNINIDMEHKLLLALLNALEVVARHPDEKESLKFFIDQLYQSAKDHFHHEEKLQLKYLYPTPYYNENIQGHKLLMEELDVIKSDIYSYADKPDTSPEEVEEIVKKIDLIMRDWFIQHIIKSDLKMKGFMDNTE